MSENDSFYDLRGSCVHFSQSGGERGQVWRRVSELYINSYTILELKSPAGLRHNNVKRIVSKCIGQREY